MSRSSFIKRKTLMKIILCMLLATLAGCASNSQPTTQTPAKPAAGEMLVNGNFAEGNANWTLEQNTSATGQVDVVNEGPAGQPALRLKVLTVSDTPWHLQLFHKGLRIEKDKNYVLTFWAKSDRAGNINVNCMQNHEPWDHHIQKEIALDTQWKQIQFTFAGPWDDDNARICFTNL